MKFNFKKSVAVVAIVITPIFLMGVKCDKPSSGNSNTATARCKHDGLKKVWAFSKPKPGSYFTCGKAKCAVEFKAPGKKGTFVTKAYFPDKPTWITIPAGFKDFKQSGCSSWYKRTT